jgi:hypothetical protein
MDENGDGIFDEVCCCFDGGGHLWTTNLKVTRTAKTVIASKEKAFHGQT